MGSRSAVEVRSSEARVFYGSAQGVSVERDAHSPAHRSDLMSAFQAGINPIESNHHSQANNAFQSPRNSFEDGKHIERSGAKNRAWIIPAPFLGRSLALVTTLGSVLQRTDQNQRSVLSPWTPCIAVSFSVLAYFLDGRPFPLIERMH